MCFLPTTNGLEVDPGSGVVPGRHISRRREPKQHDPCCVYESLPLSSGDKELAMGFAGNTGEPPT